MGEGEILIQHLQGFFNFPIAYGILSLTLVTEIQRYNGTCLCSDNNFNCFSLRAITAERLDRCWKDFLFCPWMFPRHKGEVKLFHSKCNLPVLTPHLPSRRVHDAAPFVGRRFAVTAPLQCVVIHPEIVAQFMSQGDCCTQRVFWVILQHNNTPVTSTYKSNSNTHSPLWGSTVCSLKCLINLPAALGWC